MKISEYLKLMFRCFLKTCGLLLVIVTVYLSIYSIEAVKPLVLWQIILTSSTYTLLKFAYVNQYDIDEKYQNLSLFICSTLGDIIMMILVWSLNPSLINESNFLLYIILIFAVKAVVFAMMYIDGQAQAKQLNEKLMEYRKSYNK